MRASMAYFAGAGTVIAAIVGGVGGGLLIADMISPKSPKQAAELTRLERRMSPEPISGRGRAVGTRAISDGTPAIGTQSRRCGGPSSNAGEDASRQFGVDTCASG